MTPRQFLEEFVEPAISEWQSEPLSVRRAIVGLCEIDNLAEHTILYEWPTITRDALTAERNRVGASVRAVALVRDAHDSHKHGRLSRRSARITSGERPRGEYKGGAFQAGAFQEDAFNVGTPILVLVEDDGTEHAVEAVINGALAYWHRELIRLGL